MRKSGGHSRFAQQELAIWTFWELEEVHDNGSI
jgi:hypothetical protein